MPAARLRLVFFGTPAAAVPSFEALADSHDVVLAVTQPARGRGRGRERPVADAAARHGIPVVSPAKAKEAAAAIEACVPEAAAVVAFGQILPPSVLKLFPLGMVNLHFSLLPRFRGAAPVERAILAGDQLTGVTTMVLEEGMDTGPLLLNEEVAMEQGETAGELTARLAALGAPLLVRSLEELADGSLTPVPQDDARATLAPKLTVEEGELRWSEEAEGLVRRVRACNPRPGAFTMWRGKRLKVLRARAGDPHHGLGPGRLVTEPLRAAAADNFVVLDSVQLEGRQPVEGDAFARGARMGADDALG